MPNLIGTTISIAPDMDVITFRLGIPYSHPMGHRGFSHSIMVAFIISLTVAYFFIRNDYRPRVAAPFLFISMSSHGVLDCFTNGGLGIALLWPFNNDRLFAPFQLIEASPLRLSRFFSAEGLNVLISELIWVWLPLFSIAILRRFFWKKSLAGK